MKKIFYVMFVSCVIASCAFIIPVEAKGKRKNVDIKLVHFALRAAFDLGLQGLNFDLGSPESHSFTLTVGYFF